MDIIIAGGGAAAFEAAAAARKNSPDCRIEIHSAEDIPPYRRPALPGLICADEAEFTKIFIRKDDFYRDNNISLVLNSKLTGVDHKKKQAVFNHDQICSYDKLILATGGKAFIPDIPGKDGKNVLALRCFNDLKTLRSKIASGARRITVIGGGILGLEIIDSLLKCGASVTLLERSERLLKRNISLEDSMMMMESLADIENFRLICNACTEKITDSGAVLTGGTLIASDLVIFSTGSVPELSGVPSDIATGCGIIVDARMQTSLPDIFACGDNSQFNGKVCGLYSTCRAMAAVAGINASGGSTEYVPKENSIMLNTLGFKMSNDGKVTKK